MVIDIQPTQREASDFEKTIMEFYGYDRMYYFIQDGKEHSVRWTDETIKSFLPSWSVSEYMENHLQKYAAMFARCARAWEKQVHPYWTEGNTYYDSESYKGVPVQLTQRYQKDSARYFLNNSYQQFTKPLEFVVVCR